MCTSVEGAFLSPHTSLVFLVLVVIWHTFFLSVGQWHSYDCFCLCVSLCVLSSCVCLVGTFPVPPPKVLDVNPQPQCSGNPTDMVEPTSPARRSKEMSPGLKSHPHKISGASHILLACRGCRVHPGLGSFTRTDPIYLVPTGNKQQLKAVHFPSTGDKVEWMWSRVSALWPDFHLQALLLFILFTSFQHSWLLLLRLGSFLARNSQNPQDSLRWKPTPQASFYSFLVKWPDW